jgi:ferric-dicitrate binding protein FerR (iron transport regulator)
MHGYPAGAMPSRLPRRLFLSGLGASWPATRSAFGAEPAGAVEIARGECYALAAAARRPLAPASEVFVGDAVGTGPQSALGLHLGAATQVKLGAEARLRIDRFLVNAGGTLVLERGAMVYDHDASAGQTNATVRSPFGLVAVRGTRFFAGPSNGVFGVFVERGAVTVTGVRTTVLLVSGFGTDIGQPGGEPTEPHPWGAGRIASAFGSASP